MMDMLEEAAMEPEGEEEEAGALFERISIQLFPDL